MNIQYTTVNTNMYHEYHQQQLFVDYLYLYLNIYNIYKFFLKKFKFVCIKLNLAYNLYLIFRE